jgi:hypothetical protein
MPTGICASIKGRQIAAKNAAGSGQQDETIHRLVNGGKRENSKKKAQNETGGS